MAAKQPHPLNSRPAHRRSADLDAAAVARITCAISACLSRGRLVRTLMEAALDVGAASSGAVLLLEGGELQVAATGRSGVRGLEIDAVLDATESPDVDAKPGAGTGGVGIRIGISIGIGTDAALKMPGLVSLPSSVLAFVQQSGESVLIDDAGAAHRFSRDPYFAAANLRSLVCVPLHVETELAGVVYLEHGDGDPLFTLERFALLEQIVAQAGVSLRNARRFRQLEEERRALLVLVEQRSAESHNHLDLLDALFANAPTFMFVKDASGRYLRHGPGLATLFGRPGESLVGRRDADVCDAEAAAQSRRQEREVIDLGVALHSERSWSTEAGNRHVVMHRFPLRDGAGRVHALAGMGVDVTDLRQAQHEAAQAGRAKTDFLANMSHEIRTPMNAILGMSHLALKSGLNPQQQNYVRKVERSAESLLGLLSDILDFSRIESGGLEMESVDFSLVTVLEGLANLTGLKAEEKGLELIFVESPDLHTALVGDALRLSQVLVNLANNAVRFTDRGEVVISVEQVQRHGASVILRFTVADTGVGMTAEQMSRMSRPFTQADVSAARSYGGTGLGLAISHHLVGLMGGKLGARSVPGQGSSFFFEARFGMRLPGDASRRTLPDAAPRASVLVVDDNTSARKIVTTLTRSLGFEADEARDGWDALRRLSVAIDAGTPFGLVLLDWKMPVMDGVECAHQIVSTLGEQAPAIVMMSAFGREEVLQQLSRRKISVSDVLAKPVMPAALMEATMVALGHAGRDGPAGDGRTGDRSRLRGARLLLVEDNPINQELAVELLQEVGALVTVAEDGQQALDVLATQTFDGVLMDCQMPVLDGYETTRAIRADPRWRKLPVLALTANALTGDRERALKAGMNDHIAKPINVDTMFDTILRWVQVAPSASAATAPRRKMAAADPLESLAGIDASVGRASTMGNDKLYVRLLGMFRIGQSDFLTQFTVARAAGDAATATRLAHNLRTVSASLGATGVARTSRLLEVACHEGAEESVLRPLVAQVMRELEPVITGLQALDAKSA